jgi:glucose/arabinose dehydrogenase
LDKSLLASRDGRKLYVGVGSNSNIAEHGMAIESRTRGDPRRSTSPPARGRIFASGLRNPGRPGLAAAGRCVVDGGERARRLGSDLVPDYLTWVREGGFYGWPYSYYGAHVDMRVQPQDPALVARAIKPDYALGAHVAALGLAFYDGKLLPRRYADGAFMACTAPGTAIRPGGYKVVFVPFANGQPSVRSRTC